MGLSLLLPAALGLGALAVLPVIAHMARQRPRDRQAFGAVMLLERVVKRLRRRRRLKDPLLALLRILAVLLLVLAVTGMRFTYQGGTPEVGGSGRVVVVIDRSMSMSLVDQGGTLLARAIAQADARLARVPRGTLVGLVDFAADARRLTPNLTQDVERVRAKLRDVSPSREVSNLRAALLEARRMLGGEQGEVVLFSDEAGPNLVQDATAELALLLESGSALDPQSVRADPPRNVAVVAADYGAGIEGGRVAVTVRNFGPAALEVACEVQLPDGQAVPIFVELPADGTATEEITVPPEALGGVGRAWCEDPDLRADDSRYFHLPRVGASRVMVVDGDPGDTPIRSEVYFLERALAPWGGLRTGVRPEVTTPSALSALDPEVHRVVFVANVADPRQFGPSLTEFVRKGGNLIISVGDNVTADRYNAALGAILPAPLRKVGTLAAQGEPGIPLQLPTNDLDLFGAFERSGRESFARVRSRRVMTLEPYEDSDEVTTLLRYEGGVTALVERRIGAGRVILWTSSVDLAWSNLPLQSVFMPLVQRLVTYVGGEAGSGAARFDALVGETVAIPLPDLTLEPDVLGPNGEPVHSRVDGSRLVFVPDAPGAYEVRIESAPALAFIAVNTDPIESDVRVFEPQLAAIEAQLEPELFVREVDLSPWLLAAALALLLLAGLLAVGGVRAARRGTDVEDLAA